MKKKEFLDLLRYYLKSLPQVAINDIIYDYEQHFEWALAKGKSEEEICRELGSPQALAEEYLDYEIFGGHGRKHFRRERAFGSGDVEYKKEAKAKSSSAWKWIAVILIIILFPAILGAGVGIIALLIGFVATAISLIVAGIALPFSAVIGIPSAYPLIFHSPLHPVTNSFIGIFLLFLGIGLLYLMVKIIKLAKVGYREISNGFRWKKHRKEAERGAHRAGTYDSPEELNVIEADENGEERVIKSDADESEH